MPSEASCCCGALKVTASGDPVFMGICNCDDCKRRTGSAFGWSVYFPEDQVAVEGKRSVYNLQNGQRRRFCPNCGSTLFWTGPATPGWIGIAGGAFGNERQAPEPRASFADEKRLRWVSLPDDWTLNRQPD